MGTFRQRCFVVIATVLAIFAGEPGHARSVNISSSWLLPHNDFPVFYRHFRDKVTWFEADAVCQFHHAQLATVESNNQFEAIRGYLKELDVTENVWIGLKRNSEASEFTWTNYQPLIRSGHFREEIPRSSDPVCVVTDPTANFKWHSLHCGGPEVASFVCELPVPYWASKSNGCMTSMTEGMTVTFLPESPAIQLTKECCPGYTKNVTCKGNMKQSEIMEKLSCSKSNKILKTLFISSKPIISDIKLKTTTSSSESDVEDYAIEMATIAQYNDETFQSISKVIGHGSGGILNFPQEMSIAQEPIKSLSSRGGFDTNGIDSAFMVVTGPTESTSSTPATVSTTTNSTTNHSTSHTTSHSTSTSTTDTKITRRPTIASITLKRMPSTITTIVMNATTSATSTIVPVVTVVPVMASNLTVQSATTTTTTTMTTASGRNTTIFNTPTTTISATSTPTTTTTGGSHHHHHLHHHWTLVTAKTTAPTTTKKTHMVSEMLTTTPSGLTTSYATTRQPITVTTVKAKIPYTVSTMGRLGNAQLYSDVINNNAAAAATTYSEPTATAATTRSMSTMKIVTRVKKIDLPRLSIATTAATTSTTTTVKTGKDSAENTITQKISVSDANTTGSVPVNVSSINTLDEPAISSLFLSYPTIITNSTTSIAHTTGRPSSTTATTAVSMDITMVTAATATTTTTTAAATVTDTTAPTTANITVANNPHRKVNNYDANIDHPNRSRHIVRPKQQHHHSYPYILYRLLG